MSEVSKDLPYFQDAQNKIREADHNLTGEKINKAVEEATSIAQVEAEKARQQAAGDSREAEASRQALQQERSKGPDLSSIVEQWKPLVGLTLCSFISPYTGQQTSVQGGSGTAIKFSNQPLSIVTNKHVVTDEFGNGAYGCVFILPDRTSNIYGKIIGTGKGVGVFNDDVAFIYIKDSDNYLNNLTSILPKFCQRKPVEGENVLILGYPAIGSSESITATQGIISGFEGNYFITDAKFDHGSSGGAAILVKDNSTARSKMSF